MLLFKYSTLHFVFVTSFFFFFGSLKTKLGSSNHQPIYQNPKTSSNNNHIIYF